MNPSYYQNHPQLYSPIQYMQSQIVQRPSYISKENPIRISSPNHIQRSNYSSINQQYIMPQSLIQSSPNFIYNQEINPIDELDRKYNECIQLSRDLLHKMGITININENERFNENLDELYEKAIKKSQATINKFNKLNGSNNKQEIIDIDFEEEEKVNGNLFSENNEFIYDGELINGSREGFGVLKNEKKEEIYFGEWKNNQFNGKGKLKNLKYEPFNESIDPKNLENIETKWEFYEGDFYNDKFHGLGSLFFGNGEKYCGTFFRGNMDGEGTFYYRDGDVELGIWDKNILVSNL